MAIYPSLSTHSPLVAPMSVYLLAARIALLCLVLAALSGVQAHVVKHCKNPAVRQEWRTLSWSQRKAWVDAVKCLAKLPHDDALTPIVDPSISLIPPVNKSSSFYDDISYMHMDLNALIHYTGLFLPWHRAYILGFEQALKSKCGYNGSQPYWDWTQDAPDFYHATIFDDDPEVGFGRWGDPNNDYQISTGAFSTDFPVSYPVPHTIRRNFTLQPLLVLPPFPGAPSTDPFFMINTTFTKNNTDSMVNSYVGDYVKFQAYFEGIFGPHGGPHIILGGDMSGTCPKGAGSSCAIGPKWTPNDPLFFMHHAMVDKVWYDWQHKAPENFWAYQGGSVATFFDPVEYAKYPTGSYPFYNFSTIIPSDGLLWTNKTIFHYMDTRSEDLCYIYK